MLKKTEAKERNKLLLSLQNNVAIVLFIGGHESLGEHDYRQILFLNIAQVHKDTRKVSKLSKAVCGYDGLAEKPCILFLFVAFFFFSLHYFFFFALFEGELCEFVHSDLFSAASTVSGPLEKETYSHVLNTSGF